MSKPVVLIAEELSPATLDALGPDFEVRHVDGADRSALLPAIADVDAVLIRSATSPPLPSSPSACCSPARATSLRPTKH